MGATFAVCQTIYKDYYIYRLNFNNIDDNNNREDVNVINVRQLIMPGLY